MLLLKSRPEIKPGSLNDHQSAALMFNIHLLVLSKRQCRNMCNVCLDMCFCCARGGCKTYNSIVRGDPESRHANCARPDCDLRPCEEKNRSAMAVRAYFERVKLAFDYSLLGALAIWNGHLSLLERVRLSLSIIFQRICV